MNSSYPLPRISEVLFGELRDMMAAESDFPPTHAEWLALWQRRRIEETQRGHHVFFVDIRPDDFARFCATFTPPFPYMWGALAKYVDSVAAAKAGR
jgi:hypothetical protein